MQKLKRFFMIDLVHGLGLTLKYNIGAIFDKDAVAGRESTPSNTRKFGLMLRRVFMVRRA